MPDWIQMGIFLAAASMVTMALLASVPAAAGSLRDPIAANASVKYSSDARQRFSGKRRQ